MIEPTEPIKIGDSTKKLSLSKTLGMVLFDKENPEMITRVLPDEVDLFSNLLELTQEENKLRESLKLDSSNILETVLKKNLVLRTSIKGWRSEQGERIITSVNDEDQVRQSGFLGKLGRNIK